MLFGIVKAGPAEEKALWRNGSENVARQERQGARKIIFHKRDK